MLMQILSESLLLEEVSEWSKKSNMDNKSKLVIKSCSVNAILRCVQTVSDEGAEHHKMTFKVKDMIRRDATSGDTHDMKRVVTSIASSI